jgi:hypothetical protein
MSSVRYILSDGGRIASEKRDCTVIALAHATGLPYDVCHKALAKHGRKHKRGVVFRRIAQKVAREVGFEFKPVRRSGTIRKFVQDFPKGTFYVLIRGHALTVKDGSVMDSFQTPSGSIIKIAWQVLPQGSTVPKRKSLYSENLTISKVNNAIAEFDLTLVKDKDSYGPLFYFIETSSQMHINETVLASRLNGFSLSQWVARAGLARARYNLLLAERYGLGWH